MHCTYVLTRRLLLWWWCTHDAPAPWYLDPTYRLMHACIVARNGGADLLAHLLQFVSISSIIRFLREAAPILHIYANRSWLSWFMTNWTTTRIPGPCMHTAPARLLIIFIYFFLSFHHMMTSCIFIDQYYFITAKQLSLRWWVYIDDYLPQACRRLVKKVYHLAAWVTLSWRPACMDLMINLFFFPDQSTRIGIINHFTFLRVKLFYVWSKFWTRSQRFMAPNDL